MLLRDAHSAAAARDPLRGLSASLGVARFNHAVPPIADRLRAGDELRHGAKAGRNGAVVVKTVMRTTAVAEL